MQVTKKQLTPTRVSLAIAPYATTLRNLKNEVVQRLTGSVKIQGFRQGHAPLNLVEKQLDPAALQTEFLENAVNQFYVEAVADQKLRPVEQPKVEIKKFVPYDALEFTAEVEVVGDIKIPDYRKIKVEKRVAPVAAKDVDEVIKRLQQRDAERSEVNREAKTGDEVWIDFKGVDSKTKEAINGADGKDYPLIIGSNTFIPGFEPELIGLKPGQEKTFKVKFPMDYGVKALQSRDVSFTVKVNKVQEVVEPKVDDKFAAKVGPFKTVNELKADIKKQLQAEREREAQANFENELVSKIAEKTTVVIPKLLVDEQIDAIEREERQNLTYRGQTWQEHLKAEGVSEEEHRERNREGAEKQIRAGLALSEIANKEGLNVNPEELEIRIQILKGQYNDPQMQAELDKPENRRDIANRILTEKTLAKLVDYSQKV